MTEYYAGHYIVSQNRCQGPMSAEEANDSLAMQRVEWATRDPVYMFCRAPQDVWVKIVAESNADESYQTKAVITCGAGKVELHHFPRNQYTDLAGRPWLAPFPMTEDKNGNLFGTSALQACIEVAWYLHCEERRAALDAKRPWELQPAVPYAPLTPEFYPCCGGRERHTRECKL
jgi:hypothetical protein